MRHHLCVVAVLFTAAVGRAVVYDVTADWLNSNSLAVHAGDQARILGTETQRSVNFNNLIWDGGELSLVGCRMEPSVSLTLPPLPMVVSTGQVLNLEQTWIQGADTAIVLNGGKARLSEVTLASGVANILSSHPSSRLELRNVNLCNATVGLDLQDCDSLLIEGGLFLTNITGLKCGGATHVTLQDCLFQGNEKAIVITSTGLPPTFLANVDLVDARYALIENLSPYTVDLADTHVDEPAQLLGNWTRSGVDPGVPVHPLLQSVSPTIDDDDFVDVILPLTSFIVSSGIPCKPSVYTLYEANNPYELFAETHKLSPGSVVTFNFGANRMKFYRFTCSIGEWN